MAFEGNRFWIYYQIKLPCLKIEYWKILKVVKFLRRRNIWHPQDSQDNICLMNMVSPKWNTLSASNRGRYWNIQLFSPRKHELMQKTCWLIFESRSYEKISKWDLLWRGTERLRRHTSSMFVLKTFTCLL